MALSGLAHAIGGGALIGLAATWYWFANGRVAGVSGIVGGALVSKGERRPALAFLAGLVVAGALGAAVAVSRGAPVPSQAAPVLVVAGLLVGVGTRVGGGCTSGHGVCGLSRLSRRALAATLTFIATGALTVFVVAHLLPAWRLP
jgi:uncharacterized protein